MIFVSRSHFFASGVISGFRWSCREDGRTGGSDPVVWGAFCLHATHNAAKGGGTPQAVRSKVCLPEVFTNPEKTEGEIMKKLLALLALGFMMTTLTMGCQPPPRPIFDPPGGTYGYSLDLSDPLNPVPILQEVGFVTSDPANIVFFSLDKSYPGYWDIQDPEHPNWANVATFTGSIPYLDLSASDPAGPDLTQFTSVGLLFFASGMTAPLTTTIYASELSTTNGLQSKVAAATYTLDPTMWNGDYAVVGHPPLDPMDPLTADIPLQVLVGLLTPPSGGGAGFVTIDGDLTITDLYTADPLGLLYGCYPVFAPGCLSSITGDLIIMNNPNETTEDIDAMAAAVSVGGEVIHCGNADDTACE
jgi:hypothetical protein